MIPPMAIPASGFRKRRSTKVPHKAPLIPPVAAPNPGRFHGLVDMNLATLSHVPSSKSSDIRFSSERSLFSTHRRYECHRSQRPPDCSSLSSCSSQRHHRNGEMCRSAYCFSEDHIVSIKIITARCATRFHGLSAAWSELRECATIARPR
jgi:hypothetical protein